MDFRNEGTIEKELMELNDQIIYHQNRILFHMKQVNELNEKVEFLKLAERMIVSMKCDGLQFSSKDEFLRVFRRYVMREDLCEVNEIDTDALYKKFCQS